MTKNYTIDDACKEWLDAKETERAATEARRVVEDYLIEELGPSAEFEGTKNVDAGAYKIKITSRMSRKVDGEKIQEIAAEAGLSEHLSSLFRWKPELNMSAWKSADKSITTPLLGGITTTPARASFSITTDEKE
jgi:hypothetical protein